MKYTYDDFRRVVQTLRAPDGCPWDSVQTLHSMRPYMLEESYEYQAAVRILEQTGSPENLKEELGDLLFQIVINSEIAQEEGYFTLEDVISGITEKMIRRHPKVFPEQAGTDAQTWDEIKKKEKEGKDWIASPLREIPQEHPALLRLPKVLGKVDKLYEKQPAEQEVVEELKKLTEGLSEEITEKRITDMLENVCQLARLRKLSLEQLLNDRSQEWIERFEK